MKRSLLVLLILLTLILVIFSLTGCWDSTDIDQRSIVMGVGLDTEMFSDDLVMTIEVPVLTSFVTGSDESGSSENTKVILSTSGTGIAKMANQLENRVWREIFFGHTKVIIIGEDLARQGIGPLIDFFDRNPKLERRLKLVIADGRAQDIFETESFREPLASVYLSQMLEVSTANTRLVIQNFQDTLRHLEHNGDAIVPRVRGEKEELTAAGGALIKDYKFIAWLGENETQAISFLYNNVKGGIVSAQVEHALYTYTIRNSRTKISPHLDPTTEKLSFLIEVEAEGDLVEVFCPQAQKTVVKALDEIEIKLNKIIGDEIRHTLKKLQDLQVDPIGFSILTKRKYPKFWQEHKLHWKETILPQIEFEVKTDFTIRHTGILS